VKTDRNYISSADMRADEFYRYLRGHWSIENKLHWDVLFGEDAARVTRDHALENLNILRKMALSPCAGRPAAGKAYHPHERSQTKVRRFHVCRLYVHRPFRKVNAVTMAVSWRLNLLYTSGYSESETMARVSNMALFDGGS
jgi:hypothetical protein